MTKRFLFTALISTIILSFTACDKDDPVIVDEPELITTVNYTLTPLSGGDAITLQFRDLDGDGGDTPIVTSGTLAASETYTGSLELLNESISPVEDITEEIEEEDAEHQFFFQSTIADLRVVYNDQDGDGNPVGLSSTLVTGAAATGTLTIVLRHEPNKSAAGVSDGDLSNAGGETDIEVTFSINVQ